MDFGRLLGRSWKVKAAVLPKFGKKSPASPVSSNWNERHLSSLSQANLNVEFAEPGNTDMNLSIHKFSRVVWSVARSFLAINTCFGWVLFGTVRHKCVVVPMQNCAMSSDSIKLLKNDILPKSSEMRCMIKAGSKLENVRYGQRGSFGVYEQLICKILP